MLMAQTSYNKDMVLDVELMNKIKQIYDILGKKNRYRQVVVDHFKRHFWRLIVIQKYFKHLK